MTTSFSKAQYVSGEHEDCPESLLQIIMEEVDEIVYVSDIATYEILYLNEFGKRYSGLRTSEKAGSAMKSCKALTRLVRFVRISFSTAKRSTLGSSRIPFRTAIICSETS